MDVQDALQNLRIASLTKLTRELQQSRTPDQTLRTLQRGFAEAYGFVASVLLSTRGLSRGQYRVVQTRLDRAHLNDLPSQSPDEPGPVQSGGIVAAIIDCPEPQLADHGEPGLGNRSTPHRRSSPWQPSAPRRPFVWPSLMTRIQTRAASFGRRLEP
jgi:hypothetical protein